MIALTRPVPASIASCQLTHLARVPIDLAHARMQHAEYERALARAGCDIRQLPAADDDPDSVFVEDTAVVLDEIAIITRPGAESRRGETPAVADAIRPYRQLELLSAPATLDGGDVLRLGRMLYVGVGARTNAAGVAQFAEIVKRHGYDVTTVDVGRCLHLKSAVTEAATDVVIINPQWVDAALFKGLHTIDVDPSEPFAANVLRLGPTVLCASRYERTNSRLFAAGLEVQTVDVSELAKAEGGVTCCSVIFKNEPVAS
jgi:dimethylargininase